MVATSSLSTVWGAARALRELILPAYCAGCGARAGSCCPDCSRAFGAPRREYPPLLPHAVPAYSLARYQGVARALVLAFKERGRRDLAAPLGGELAAVLPYLPHARADFGGRWWLVPAPSRRSAARLRGGSHTEALAGQCAQRLARSGAGCAVAPALRLRTGARDAVGLDRAQRADNLAGRAAVLVDGLPPAGTPVVLLDDVLTTGATAAACARALASAGCHVSAVLTLTAAT